MIAIEFAEYLDLHSLNLTFDKVGITGNVFVGSMPDNPEGAVLVKSTGGPENDTKLPYDSPNLQVIVRGGTRGDWTAGYDVAREIYGMIHGLTSTVLPGGSRLVLARGLNSEPIDMGPDDNGRQEWSLNFELEVLALTTNRE